MTEAGSEGVSERKKRSRIFGQYIIKKYFQFKIGFWVFFILAVVTLFLWLEGNWAVNSILKTGVVTDEQAVEQLKLLVSIMGKTAILGIAVSFLASLYLSHFIAGPIYRFEKIFEEMKEGNLSVQVRLRKRDEFKDTAQILEQALISLRSKIKQERDTVALVASKIEKLSHSLEKTGIPVDPASLHALKDELGQAFKKVKISSD